MYLNDPVYITDATGEIGVTRRLGADAVRFVRRGTTYAPDVRYNSGGWTSKVTLRNNGGKANFVLKYVRSDGSIACTVIDTINAHGTYAASCTDTSAASVVLSTDQDVSFVVLQEHKTSGVSDGIGSYTGNDQPATEANVPIVQRNNSGWFSQIFIQNAGNAAATATLAFTPHSTLGNACNYTTASISPGGRVALTLADSAFNCLVNPSTRFVGAVRITSSQPLAVASTQYLGDTQFMETDNRRATTQVVYGPLVQNNNSGWLSGLTLLNASNTNATLNTVYYKADGGNCASKLYSLSAYKPEVIYPAPPADINCSTQQNPHPILSADFTSNQNLAVNVNQLNGSRATTYLAIATPGQQAIIPRLRQDNDWSDGFNVQNVNGQAANIVVRFYNSDGTLYSSNSYTLQAHALQTFAAPAFTSSGGGSAIVVADRAIAVSANNFLDGIGSTTDNIGSYAAIHR